MKSSRRQKRINVAGKATERAETYYDSSDADAFYRLIWGGEDIHVGIYEGEPPPSIAEASRETVRRMAAIVRDLQPRTKVIDLGAGFGGPMRYLAAKYDAQCSCLNISSAQNGYNERRNQEEGLVDRIRVIHGSYEDIPETSKSFDLVWSQDAILHSGNRSLVLAEAVRVLKPHGQMIFTDIMQSDSCPNNVLEPIYARLQLQSMASPSFYKSNLEQLGMSQISFIDLSNHMRTHYERVAAELRERYTRVTQAFSREYADNTLQGLDHWIRGAADGHLAWGIFHCEK